MIADFGNCIKGKVQAPIYDVLDKLFVYLYNKTIKSNGGIEHAARIEVSIF